MTLDEFKDLVNKHRPVGYAFGEFKTDTPDYRFGNPQQAVAMIYKAQTSSVVFTFRVGFTQLLIDKFNQLGALAKKHPDKNIKDMFLVTIDKNAFSEEMLALLEESIVRALRQFYQAN